MSNSAQLIPATGPRAATGRLMIIDSQNESIRTDWIRGLEHELEPGDVLVVNDAATFPASLQAKVESTGEDLEVRLLPARQPEFRSEAVLLGAGGWREKTEDRRPPPVLGVHERLRFSSQLTAEVTQVSAVTKRLVSLSFSEKDPAAFWREIYRVGKPIQYSYLSEAQKLWSVQTLYGARPWASEIPSAGRPLKSGLLLALRRKGVQLATLTHATGISSSGEKALDSLLPLPEFFEIPPVSAAKMNRALEQGRRVIAVGTSVVRALESQAAALQGRVAAGAGETALVIHSSPQSSGFRLRVVSGILTGIHGADESHFRLLRAFASEECLRTALERCRQAGFLTHEFGDSALILAHR